MAHEHSSYVTLSAVCNKAAQLAPIEVDDNVKTAAQAIYKFVTSTFEAAAPMDLAPPRSLAAARGLC
jgi:hypothetical protein